MNNEGASSLNSDWLPIKFDLVLSLVKSVPNPPL